MIATGIRSAYSGREKPLKRELVITSSVTRGRVGGRGAAIYHPQEALSVFIIYFFQLKSVGMNELRSITWLVFRPQRERTVVGVHQASPPAEATQLERCGPGNQAAAST